MNKCLMRIILNEERHRKESTYNDIIRYLWQEGVPGVTAFRSEASIDDKRQLHYQSLEDVYFDDLAIIIEAVMDKELASNLIENLEILVGRGQISIYDEMEANKIDMELMYDVRIYTREHEMLLKRSEYEKVLAMLEKAGVKWATVSKGIAGYGKDHKITRQSIFSLSGNDPILIECLAPGDKLEDVLKKINSIISEGIICTIPAQVYINK